MRLQLAFVGIVLASVAAGQTTSAPASFAASRPTETQPAPPPVESFPWWGRIAANKVNVRGGAGDFHRELVRLDRGSAVKVVARRGDWLACEVPGGLDLWIALRRGTREYLEKEADGTWVVKATSLQLRGTPSTDEPSLGPINPGTRVTLLEERGDFGRIHMPESHPGFIFNRYVESWKDTAAAEKAFAEGAQALADAKLRHDAEMRAIEARKAELKKRSEAIASADEKFNTELAKPAASRDTKGIRAQYEEVAKFVGDDESIKKRIDRRLDVVTEWEKNAEAIANATRQKAEAERRREESEKVYRDDLARLRERKESDAAKIGLEKGRYKATGWVQLAPKADVEGQPKYKIHRGDQREYYLVSDRLDFEEYRGKNIGILEGDDPIEVPGVALPIMKVRKIEIINAP